MKVGETYTRFNTSTNLLQIVICVGQDSKGATVVEDVPTGGIFRIVDKAGWTHVIKPREFWIVKIPGLPEDIYESLEEAKKDNSEAFIIHVREVLKDE